jgi:hypothetical protein
MLTLESPCATDRKQAKNLAAPSQIFRITRQPKIRLALILIYILALNGFGATIYVAQIATGDASGSSPSNRCSIDSINASWNIHAGDTISLGGTVSWLDIAGSGSAGNPITLLFESGSKMSRPNGELIYMNNVSNIIVDGGTNGIIENTATGTGMTYSNSVTFIDASGSRDLTFKNLCFQNQYIHTSSADSNPNIAACGGVYANGLGGDNYFISDVFSNVGWCLNILVSPPRSMTVSNCAFYRYDHGVVPSGTNITIINNHFDSTANWDTVANTYHHDPIHYFGGLSPSSFVIAGNLFTGDLGKNNTAMIYLETSAQNMLAYNNVFLQYPSDYLNNGMLSCGGTNNLVLNNTFAGSGVANSLGLGIGGSATVENNVFSGLTTFIYSASGTQTFNHNLYAKAVSGGNSPWGTHVANYNSFSAWQAAVGDANSINTVANVINADGTPTSGSAAVGAGTNLSGIFTTDIKGVARTAIWDIGAYQHAINVILPPANLHPQ